MCLKCKPWSFEKINKIDQTLARLTKKKRENHKLIIAEMKGIITIDAIYFKRKVKEYYEQLCPQINNLNEIDYLLERHKMPLHIEEIIRISLLIKQIEVIVNDLLY